MKWAVYVARIEKIEGHRGFWLRDTMERYHLEDVSLDGTILLNPELNPICYLLALLGAHHFLHVSRIRDDTTKP